MKLRKNNSKSGFTLIEVIVTIVVIAIVAAMMTAYFGTGITQSSIPIFRLNASAKINAILEKITSDYNNSPPTWSPSRTYNAGTIGTIILPPAASRNGYQYFRADTVTTGATEPAWPLSTCIGAACTVDGWTYSGTTPPKNWIQNTPYNHLYAVVYPTNGYQYICNNCDTSTTSGTVEPAWSTATTIGITITETTGSATKIQWTCRGPQPLLAYRWGGRPRPKNLWKRYRCQIPRCRK
jgi:prepilin-type N-terminal cleavage/methylation domain-containing protein